MTDIVDLRDGAPSPTPGSVLVDAPDPATVPTPVVPAPTVIATGDTTIDDSTADRTADAKGPDARAIGGRVVVALILVIVALVVIDIVVGSVAANERQRHLADEFAEPKADLVAGDASFVLQMPKVGANLVVVEGSTADRLIGGPGRRLDSALPGEGGNTVILARSSRFGAPFERLGDLAEGDQIALRSRAGQNYGYVVSEVRTVPSDDTEVLDPTDEARLTLVTSAGGPLDGRRRVVIAEPDGAHDDGTAEGASDEAAGPFDQRNRLSLLLLLTGPLVIAMAIVAARSLWGRYRPLTVVVVAGPAIALGVALVIFHADAFLPTTY